MPKTDIEQEIVIGTFLSPTNNILLGEDEVYQDEVTVPLVDKTELIIPDLEFMLKHEPGNYHLPLAEQRDNSLIAVGNNGYLEAHQNIGTNSVYFHLTKPLSGLDPIPTKEVKRLFGIWGPVNKAPSQNLASDRTFLFFEDRNQFQGRGTKDFLQRTVDNFASEVAGEPISHICVPYTSQGVVSISNRYGPLDIAAQTRLIQGLPELYTKLEEKFGPIRSINGEKKDN